jgi:NAD(P)-dependent dehydrogenase (short-subunit alcohol dehydrogenase family)
MVALVTGAAVGIGRAIALELLAQGMDTWLADVQDLRGPRGASSGSTGPTTPRCAN